MTRQLVITADDLGREPATTEVIAGLLRDGAVTATTLIVVSPEAPEAARRMHQLGHLPRLHATLTSERGLPPWRALSGGSSLLNADGCLPDDPFVLGRHGEPAQVVAELDAQLAWMEDQGLRPRAADSHAGTLYGLHGRSFLREALLWCARHGLGFRLPRDPTPYLGALPPELAERHAEAIELADALGVALPESMATNRRSAADLGGYEALRADYLARLADLPEGVSEIFLHPSAENAVIGPDGATRVWEARLLRDPVWLAALERESIDLVAGW